MSEDWRNLVVMYAGPPAFERVPTARPSVVPAMFPQLHTDFTPEIPVSFDTLKAQLSKLTKHQREAVRKYLDSLDALEDAGV